MRLRTRLASIVFLLVLSAPAYTQTRDVPRVLSEAERFAVTAAADFLKRGAEAFWDRLATQSPLRRLGREKALAEIEARTGPPTGASWELRTVVPSLADKTAVFSINYPSGIDETLIFNLVVDGGTYKVDTLTILAEPSPYALKERSAKQQAKVPPQAPPKRSSSRLLLVLAAGALAIASAFQLEDRRALARTLLSLSAVTVMAIVGLEISELVRRQRPAATVAAEPKDSGLSSLLGLRRSVAAGTAAPADLILTRKSLAADIAQLWHAQLLLQDMKIPEVKVMLSRFPPPSPYPLAEVLRARVGTLESKEVDAVLAYERAINTGPGHDGLWLEAAQAFYILGFEDRSRSYLSRLTRIGSRSAETYYLLSLISATKNKSDDSEKYFRQAWKLRPVERSELFEQRVMWDVLRRPTIYTALHLSSAEEPRPTPPDLPRRPIEVPAGAESRIAASFLHIAIDGQKLGVPGGSDVAPEGTPLEDAGARRRIEEEQALADLPRLAEAASSAGALTQPHLRLEIERAVEALANRNRWSDVIALTESLSPSSQNIPASLMFLRANALRRLQRTDDARRLLTALARNPAIHRRNDPDTLLKLGEQLVGVDQYALARQMMDKAASQRELPFVDDRIRQILMDQRLATKYGQFRTEHFEIRYPQETGEFFAQRVGQILEAEFKRLQTWIPVKQFRPVTVHLLWWEDFRRTYTGSDFILGFYDGKIRLPFAGLPSSMPEIVAILSHELAHAMIDQSTGGHAPRWFQEGLAQRVEMVRYRSNAFTRYEDHDIFSLPVIDGVLKGFPQVEMITEAYLLSYAIVQYIEARHGLRGLLRLQEAFRQGNPTEEALAKAFAQSHTEFDRQMRLWGRNDAPKIWISEIIRYDVSDQNTPRTVRSPRQEDEEVYEEEEYDDGGPE